MQDITQLLIKANEQLEELSATVSNIDKEVSRFRALKDQVSDFHNKVWSVKHSLGYKRAELMSFLFDHIVQIFGLKTYTLVLRKKTITATMAKGAWKNFTIGTDTIRLVSIGQDEYKELFGLIWSAMIDDIEKYITESPSDISKRVLELDTLKKRLEALPALCSTITVPS